MTTKEDAPAGARTSFGGMLAADAQAGPRPERRITRKALRTYAAVADAAQVLAVFLAAQGLVPHMGTSAVTWSDLGLGLFAAGSAAVLRRALRHSWLPKDGDLADEAPGAAVAAASAVALTVVAQWLALPQASGGGGLNWWALAWAPVAGAAAATLWSGAGWVAEMAGAGTKVVLAGSAGETAALAQAFARARRGCWHLVGRVDDRGEGGLARLAETVRSTKADIVVIQGENSARVAVICDHLADQPVRICLPLDSAVVEHLPAFLPRIGQYALVDIACDPLSGLQGQIKRGMDIVLSLVALVLLSPVLLAAALAIRSESPGPVIFRQMRFGQGGRPICVLKFRTMRKDACDVTGERRTISRDPRVTRVGRLLRRTSIDELPQLLNVIRGDMSLVGPRPHPLLMRVQEAYYHDAVRRYRARHVVRPGITGWAQVNGSRGEVDTLQKAERRVELDLWYLDNWSLWLDLRILARTALGGFFSRGAD